MALPKSEVGCKISNTVIGADGYEIVTDWQLIEASFTVASPAPYVPVTPSVQELPGSICPTCGSPNIVMLGMSASCDTCGTVMNFGATVSASTILGDTFPVNVENLEIIEKTYPIRRYRDISNDIKNRFKLLDL